MRRPSATALPLLVLLAACAGSGPEPEAPAGERIESPGLGLAIAALPEALTVVENRGRELTLIPADGAPGSLLVEVAPPPRGGVNLVAAVNDHKASIEGKPGGEYRGQVELMSPLGTAYASRGRYAIEGGETVEEMRILTLHPAGDRLLSLIYTYPTPADSEERRDHLMALLGEIEGLGTPPEAGAVPDAGTAASP